MAPGGPRPWRRPVATLAVVGAGAWFDLGDDERDALARAGRTSHLGPGAPIFTEGDPAYEVGFVLEGAVKIARTSLDGREVVLAVRHAGDVLGELSALDGRPRSATATALEPTEMLLLAIPRFLELLDEHPGIARSLLVDLAGRLRASGDQALEFGVADAMTRVCRRIIDLMQDHGRSDAAGIVIEVPVSQQELADRSGLSREAVVKALRSLRSLGWISGSGRTIVVEDEGALRRRSL